MRTRAFLAIFALLFSAGTVLSADNPLFQQANAKYQAGDFKTASELYQKSVQTGHRTAAVYYNLGNTAVKLGEKGQALVYYERALKGAPRDKDLRWNIHILKESLPDKIDDNSYFVIAWAQELLGRAAADELAILLSALLFITLLLNGAYLLFPAFKASSGPLRAVGALMLVVTAMLFAWKIWETKDPRVVVLDKETYAYYGPSDTETKAFLLHEGASGKVTDATDDWVYLSLPNKKSGWIRKNSCETV